LVEVKNIFEGNSFHTFYANYHFFIKQEMNQKQWSAPVTLHSIPFQISASEMGGFYKKKINLNIVERYNNKN